MAYLYQQQAQESADVFDLDLIWNALFGLLNSFLSRLPYVVFALVVFAVFCTFRFTTVLNPGLWRTAGQKVENKTNRGNCSRLLGIHTLTAALFDY